IREKLFKLRFDGIVNTPETTYRFTVAGSVQRQACGTVRANLGCFLHALDFSARLLDPKQFIDRRRAGVAGGEFCVETAQAAPLTQVPFRVIGAQGTSVLQCEFE